MSTAKKKLTTCEPKTAVAYARYSSAQQRDVSIEQQLKDIRAFAEREGYTIIHEYADHAKSGFKNIDRRVEFQAMLAAAATGMFDTVIAWKVDRFGRNRRESAVFKGQLSDQGVSVVYAMEPIPDGAAGVLTEGMLESLAEWYSRNISENTKRGLYDNASKARANGHKPYGYNVTKDDHLEINEAEAAVVRRIFTLYSQGYSFESIARALSADGLLTNNGRPFQKSTLLHILMNEEYIGVYHYGNIRIPDKVPAIIDSVLWHACQDQRAKTARHHEKAPVTYYLSGKLTCGRCGAPVYANYGSGRGGKRYAYYRCSQAKYHKCNSHYARAEALEKPIFDFLFNHVLQGKMLDRYIDLVSDVLAKQQETSPVKQLEREHKDIIRRIDNINRAISEGIWTASTGAMLQQLTEKADKLQKDISYQHMTKDKMVSKDRIRFLMRKAAEGKRTDPEHMKALIGSLINSVTVYDHWMRVVINAVGNVEKIPPEDLPPLEVLPDGNRFDFRSANARSLYTVEPYPVIVFKIAI